ncbi:MAG TPA: hypothetical protein VHC22_29435 [Pirellulales bacterium]|nr:hypothetical protein [Pirellulales bacterium]
MPKHFSLRLVLVAVTVACIALGASMMPVERRRRAVQAIQAVGGETGVWHEQTASETFPITLLRRWLPADYFDEVWDVRLTSNHASLVDETRVTDELLAQMEPLSRLRWLLLDNARITDEGLVHLERLTDLEVLSLSDTQVTDAGLAHLQGLTRLEAIYLRNTQVGDAGLDHLCGLTNLRALDLGDSRVTGEGSARLQKALPNCQINLSTQRLTFPLPRTKSPRRRKPRSPQ